MNSSERSKSAINAHSASLSRVRRQIDSVTALANSDALRAFKRRADEMTELTETEILRRQKIAAARRSVNNHSGQGGSAGRASKLAKARAFAESVYPVMQEIAGTQETLSYMGIAEALNARQITASRGGLWSAKQVQRIWSSFNSQQ